MEEVQETQILYLTEKPTRQRDRHAEVGCFLGDLGMRQDFVGSKVRLPVRGIYGDKNSFMMAMSDM